MDGLDQDKVGDLSDEILDDKQFHGHLCQMGGHAGNFWLRNYNNLTEADREEMKVDEIFALYLYRLSNRTNEQYWKKSALPFVILFRECLNEYGWQKATPEK